MIQTFNMSIHAVNYLLSLNAIYGHTTESIDGITTISHFPNEIPA